MLLLFGPGVNRQAAWNSLARVCVVLGALWLSACASNNQPPKMGPPPFMPVEFALPPDTEIDHDGTIVLGDRMQWYGTLAMTSKSDLDEVHRFYSKALASEGWQELSQLVSDKVVMQFLNRKRGRACIVTIEGRTLRSGTHIEVVMAPLTAGAG